MKYYDRVRLIRDSEYYKENQLKAGDEGEIIFPEIRDNTFYVRFETGDEKNFYNFCDIKIEDLELVEDAGTTDKTIKNAMPKYNTRWWCKVEDGYITNLNGERKNKVPYDYNS